MNTLNPTKNPYLTGTENRTSTNNNRNGVIAKLFGRKANNPLTQSSNTKSDNKSLNTTTTGSRADAANSRVDISSSRGSANVQEQSQVNTGKANENLAKNSQIQGNTKEGGCSCGGGCAGGCGCGCA